ALVEPGLVLGYRRPLDVQRALDGARRAVAEAAGAAVSLVGTDVEQAVEAQAGGDEAALPPGAHAPQPVGGAPGRAGAHVQFVDGAEQVGHDARGDGAHALVALGMAAGVDALQQLLDAEFIAHGLSPERSGSGRVNLTNRITGSTNENTLAGGAVGQTR